MAIQFLNVDLEIESDEPLQPLADYFGDKVIVLSCGERGNYYQAAFEAPSEGDPDTLIGYFCTLIESLRKKERKMWDSAFLRDFNLGYESGLEPQCFESKLRSTTISRIRDIGASITVTIYPPGC